MSTALRLQAAVRRPALANVLQRPSQWRRFSTIPAPDGTLPLAGIRVLDMTRVLAGVCVLLLNLFYGVYWLLIGFP